MAINQLAAINYIHNKAFCIIGCEIDLCTGHLLFVAVAVVVNWQRLKSPSPKC